MSVILYAGGQLYGEGITIHMEDPPTIPRKQNGSDARLKTLLFRNFVAGVGAQMMKQTTFSAGMILTLIRHCKEVQNIKRKDTAEILNPCY